MAKSKFVDISMVGDKELERMFRDLPVKLQTKVVRQANTKAIRPILRSVKARVPVLTGVLKRGLKSRAMKRKRRNSPIGRFLLLPLRADLGIKADDPYYYPAAVEYGHDNVAAVRFLRDGFDAAEEEAFGILKKEIGAGVEREAKKLAGGAVAGAKRVAA